MTQTTQPTEGLAPERDHLLVRRFRLRVVAGPDEGRTYITGGQRVVIGTHASTDLRLTDPTMSRFHCEIALESGKAMLRDLGSRNGTLVDGVAILLALLRDQMTLQLGRTRIRFEVAGKNARIALSRRDRFGLLVGRSYPMRALFSLLEQAAPSDRTVLLQGETGTGKDVAAESIHLESDRCHGPFVVVDCGALPPGLLESELFGHERGAFTGAHTARVGAFELAHHGTLFLDEIGELALDVQPKFLRLLESRQVRRIGGSEVKTVDVRVIAATNRNLRAEVNARRFRADLYYRLAVLDVTLPPLRERLDDVPLLVDDMLRSLAEEGSPTAERLRSPEVLDQLRGHAWPGNTRELRNYLSRCLAVEAAAPLDAPMGETPFTVDSGVVLRVARDRFERRYLEALLARHEGKVTPAARAAGITRVHLHRLMTRFGMR